MTQNNKHYLAIDTVTEQCSVAISHGGEVTQWLETGSKQHSRHLLDMIHIGLKEIGITLGELDGVIADVGPGSFTGVRVGLGVAQGIAYAQDIPVCSVNSLDALVFEAAQKISSGRVLSALDARMSQVYWGLYEVSSDGRTSVVIDPEVNYPDQLFNQLLDLDGKQAGNTRVFGVGDGWQEYEETLTDLKQAISVDVIDKIRYPQARTLIEMVLMARADLTWQDPLELHAFYIRNQVAEKSKKRLRA